MTKIYYLKISKSEEFGTDIVEFKETNYISKEANLIVENYNTSFSLFLINKGCYKEYLYYDKIIEDYFEISDTEFYLTLRDKNFEEIFDEFIDDCTRKLNKIPRKISNFIWNIKNIISWIPVLYNCFEWDMDFHLQLSIHKLKQMAKFFKNDAHVLDKNESAYYLKRAIYFGELAMMETDDLELKQQYLDEHYSILKTHHISIWD